MGLIDLKTDLKSLKYGGGSFGDRRGGGWSGQPYITTDIPEEPEGARTDFLLRQGALTRSGKDVSRLEKLLTDNKSLNGVGFITKQQLLSSLNPIVLGRPNRQSPISGLYNPANTLAQAAGNVIGLHLEKQGISPIFDSTQKYFNLTKEFNENPTNKLVLLYNNKIQNTPISPTGALLYGIDTLNPNNLFNYIGGPGGVKTTIQITNPTIKETDTVETNPSLKSGRERFLANGYKYGKSGLNFLGATNEYFTYSIINGELIPDPSFENITILSGISTDEQQEKLFGPSDNNATFSTEDDKLDLYKKSNQPKSDKRVNNTKTVLGSISKLYISPEDTTEDLTRVNSSTISPNDSLNLQNPIIVDPITEIKPGFEFEYDPSQENRINSKTTTRVLGLSSKYKYNLDFVDNDTLIPTRATAQPSSSQNPIIEDPSTQITPGESSTPYYNEDLPIYTPENKAGKDIIDAASTYGRSKAVSYRINTSTESTNPNLYTSTTQNNDLENSDIIKFYIEVINNDSLQSEYLYFRAYIDDFGDSFSSTWNDTKYVGRAENFYTYGGFNRSISLGFTIYAHSQEELFPNVYTKLNQLAGIVSPDYSDVGFMRGNYVKLTVGDYLYNVPGVITGFKLDGLLDGGWEIEDGLQLPKHIKVSGMEFKPIHDFVPRKGASYFNVK